MSISPEIVQLIIKNKTFSQFQKEISKRDGKQISKQTFYNYKNKNLDTLTESRIKYSSILKDLSYFQIDRSDDKTIHIDINGLEQNYFCFLDIKKRRKEYTRFIQDVLDMDRELNNLEIYYIDSTEILKGKTGIQIIVHYSSYDLDKVYLRDQYQKESHKLKYLDKLSINKKLYTVFFIEKQKKIYHIPYENIIEIKLEANKDHSDDNMLSIYENYSQYTNSNYLGYKQKNTIRNIRIPII